MNKHAVKAANLRAEYIIEKDQYGVHCNKCSKGYIESAIKDFTSFCYTTTCDIDISNLTDNKTVACNNTITEIATANLCTNRVNIIDCDIDYTGCIMNNVEDNSYIYTRVITNNETVYFTISSIIVNDVIYLSADTDIEISPDTISISRINGNNYITNVVDFINDLKIDNFRLTPYYITSDKILFETDGNTFSVTTKANLDGDSLTRGVIITEDGLQSVQLTVAAAYTPVGSLTSPESTVFIAGKTCSTYSKC